MDYNIVIIGAGPAGYVAAIRAGQLGFKTAIIEKKHIGGMCLNWGCIPSKSFIESSKLYKKIKNAESFGITGIDKNSLNFDWLKAKKRSDKIVTKLSKGVEFLLKKNNIDIIKETAKITSPTTITVENRTIETENIIIATGSFSEKTNFIIDSDKLIQLNRLFDLETLPDNIVLYGSGPVIIELAQLFNFIDKQVTVLFSDADILPSFDEIIKENIIKQFKSEKIKFYFSDEYEIVNGNSLKIKDAVQPFDIFVNCSERRAVLPHSDIKLELDSKGFLKVNSQLQTNYNNIYAVGDVNGKSFLAHPASAQGILAVNNIKGLKTDFDIEKYPLNLYSSPEAAQIGKTETKLKSENIDYKVSTFPLSANGKALIEDDTTGFVRILSDTKYGEILGVQIMSENATDLISEAAAFMSAEATVYEIAQTIHAHPTISEVFYEAGLDSLNQAIHK